MACNVVLTMHECVYMCMHACACIRDYICQVSLQLELEIYFPPEFRKGCTFYELNNCVYLYPLFYP